MNWKIKLICGINERIVPSPHFFAFPACDSTFVDSFCFIRNYQIRIYANDVAISSACRTSTKWIVEVKEMLGRFYKCNTVSLKSLRECFNILIIYFRQLYCQHTLSSTFIECSLYGVRKAIECTIFTVRDNTINKQICILINFCRRPYSQDVRITFSIQSV